MSDVLREGLANYVPDKYLVVKGVEVGSIEEPSKKKSRKAVASRKRRAITRVYLLRQLLKQSKG